jgi:hypothetical protein
MEAGSTETQLVQPEDINSSCLTAGDGCQPSTSNSHQEPGRTEEAGELCEQANEQGRHVKAKQPRWPRVRRALIVVTKAILVMEGIAWAVAVIGSNRRRARSSDEESEYDPVERLVDYLEGRTGRGSSLGTA